MKNKEIAMKIQEHLSRFEEAGYKTIRGDNKYFYAHSWSAGRYVAIKYISYQCQSNLSNAEAEKYLDWLDAGNIGKHFDMNHKEQI